MPVARAASAIATAKLAYVGVRLAVWRMMQIVEFADPRKPGFQHLDISERGDRFDFVGFSASANRYI